MWIPHFGLIPWPREGIDKNIIEKSKQDKSERYFYVGFYLENCDTRKINDSTVALEKEEIKSLKKEDGSLIIEIKFTKNKQNRLAKIDTRLKRDNYLTALREAYNIITTFVLSIQSFQSGSNLAIWAIGITDDVHKAEWLCKPQSAAPNSLKLPEGIDIDEEFKAVLALYREAKNNSSPFYRFFCYYKILEAFYERADIFRKIDKIIKERDLPIKRQKRRITRNDLISALVGTNSKYLGMSFGKFFEALRSNERLMVAHTFPKNKPFVNIDDFDLFTEYASVGNLADIVSRQLLLDELNLHHQVVKLLLDSMKENEKGKRKRD